MTAVAASTLIDDLPGDLRVLVLRLANAVGSDATKNKAYQATALGRAAARPYLAWKENEDGAAEATLDVEPKVTRGRRMHTTRHTYATDLGKATDWNMVAVQKNLGHSSIDITVDTYTQFAYDDQAAAVAKLPEIGED